MRQRIGRDRRYKGLSRCLRRCEDIVVGCRSAWLDARGAGAFPARPGRMAGPGRNGIAAGSRDWRVDVERRTANSDGPARGFSAGLAGSLLSYFNRSRACRAKKELQKKLRRMTAKPRGGSGQGRNRDAGATVGAPGRVVRSRSCYADTALLQGRRHGRGCLWLSQSADVPIGIRKMYLRGAQTIYRAEIAEPMTWLAP